MDLVLDKFKFSRRDSGNIHKKYYIVRISQSKRGRRYLIIRKEEAGCCMKKKRRFTLRFLKLSRAFSTGIAKDAHS